MSDIGGREFDWFCIDRNGRLAVVATSGRGVVPREVLAFADAHDALGDSIEVLNWGTEGVWQSYAAVGLYVYDWDDRRGAYRRLAMPTVPAPPDLAASFLGTDGVPRLNVDFDRDEVIQVS